MKKPKTLTVKPSDYQPSKAELEEKVRIDTSPQNLATALMQDVKIKRSECA